MSKETVPSLVEHLKQIPDPRVKRTQRHELMDISGSEGDSIAARPASTK